MALNTGKGYRQGQISKRTQAYNPTTSQYVKRDADTGKFMSCKNTVYKGVVKESTAKTQQKK